MEAKGVYTADNRALISDRVSCRSTDLVEIVLQISEQADVERRHSFFVHDGFALEEGSTQLLELLQTLGHVSNLHGIADRLDGVGELLKPGAQWTPDRRL